MYICAESDFLNFLRLLVVEKKMKLQVQVSLQLKAEQIRQVSLQLKEMMNNYNANQTM